MRSDERDPVSVELENVTLRELLTNVVVAAARLRDDWAESDKAVRRKLWTDLHTAAENAYDFVYPLGGQVDSSD